ncbi:MFS transporter [Streptomyces sp. NPDC085639]|uniref:MFS transporter n=1 Tax=Streptomyces sp. NPDC085639 TaxID=3365734 RepID=UPI0037D05424
MASLDTARPVSARPALPRVFLVWLIGTRASLFGDAVLYFALGWAASAHGGGTAALVLTAVTLPRTLLLLLGGAVGDRFGARRVMITGDIVMLTVTLVLALVGTHFGASPWLLVMVAVVIGTVDAFYLPATGSMPRRLVGKEQLPRALAMHQAGSQIVSLLGAPAGAVLVAAAGLTGAAAADAVTFAIVLMVLVRVRPAFDVERSPREEGSWRRWSTGCGSPWGPGPAARAAAHGRCRGLPPAGGVPAEPAPGAGTGGVGDRSVQDHGGGRGVLLPLRRVEVAA